MKKLLPIIAFVALAALVGATPALLMARADDEANPAAEQTAGSISWTKPAGWISETPGNKMRKAQYKLPRAEGDSEDAGMVVYHFGGSAGGIEANVERWLGQWQKDDGSAFTLEDAKISKSKSGTLKLTTVELEGHFVAAVRPGAAERHDKPDHAMLAVIVTSPEGNYFFKLLGPKATLAKWQESFETFRGSIKPKTS